MDVLTELAKVPVFSIEDVEKIKKNKSTAYSQLSRFIDKGKVKKIRNNLYSLVNPITGQMVANRYQIACAISDTAYLSHHSAFEYYGFANQVYNEVYVSSETRFNSFEYDNITYKYVASRMAEGVVVAKNTTGVRITDIERTIIDSIHDLNKIAGLEELLNCLEGVRFLNEDKLRLYLDHYDTQGLYQKTGFLLGQLKVSKDLIEYCQSKIGKSKKYLIGEPKGSSNYNREWNLMVPRIMFEPTEKSGC